MYIPEFNRQENRAATLAFMRANPFAILVSKVNGVPFATHLPVLIEEQGDQIIVQGHMAKANAHWKSMKEGRGIAGDIPRSSRLHFAQLV